MIRTRFCRKKDVLPEAYQVLPQQRKGNHLTGVPEHKVPFSRRPEHRGNGKRDNQEVTSSLPV
jgi:hypothetical protein